MIVDRLVRATLPIAGPVSGPPGTAFLYNHLLRSTDGVDHVVELLVTADAFAQHEMLEFKLRPDMIEPVGAASDNLLVTDVARSWTHDSTGFAFVPSAFLHLHGRRKGWRWTTQEVTDGFAAQPQDVADIGADPCRGFLLGHTVDGPGRPLVLMSGSVRRDDDAGVVRWVGPVPAGMVGSPVFTVRQLDALAFKVICLGVLLAGTQDNLVATFDAIRHAVALTLPAR
jgi:hypothetical protein